MQSTKASARNTIEGPYYRPSSGPRRTPVETRPLPHNADAERSILGAILLDGQKVHAAIEKLKPEDFFLDQHRRIFHHMIEMAKAQQVVDLVTLSDQLLRKGELEAAGGGAYLSQLVDGVPRIAHLEFYAEIVREKSALRQMIHAADLIQEQAFEGENPSAIIDRAAETLAGITGRASPLTWMQKFHTIEELPDGEPRFLINSFVPEGVTFVGALSGDGKTWVCLSMGRALTTGKPFLGVWSVPEPVNVLYLCPEMNAATFRRRCKRFGIGGERFRCMTISDGTPLDLADPLLAAAIRDLKPVIFLDTAIRFSSAEEENSASQNAQGLARAIFRLIHLGARAVVCLHHRAKETAKAEEMTLENTLRGSGDIGAMCDAVWGLQYDRGDGTAHYLKESRKLVRLSVRCVKARDFRQPEDFRVQLDSFIDQIGDMAVLTDEPEGAQESEVDRLDKAIFAKPDATKVELQESTGIGRNRIEKLAAEKGWTYEPKAGWTRVVT